MFKLLILLFTSTIMLAFSSSVIDDGSGWYEIEKYNANGEPEIYFYNAEGKLLYIKIKNSKPYYGESPNIDQGPHEEYSPKPHRCRTNLRRL
jgi:hypothetical protein